MFYIEINLWIICKRNINFLLTAKRISLKIFSFIESNLTMICFTFADNSLSYPNSDADSLKSSHSTSSTHTSGQQTLRTFHPVIKETPKCSDSVKCENCEQCRKVKTDTYRCHSLNRHSSLSPYQNLMYADVHHGSQPQPPGRRRAASSTGKGSGNKGSWWNVEDVKCALCFYAPGLKGPPGASSNQIVRLSVCLSVRLSVRNSVPLTIKVQYLKFGCWYNYQTWTVSSSKGCSHFTDITRPWGLGRGQNVGLRDFCHNWT